MILWSIFDSIFTIYDNHGVKLVLTYNRDYATILWFDETINTATNISLRNTIIIKYFQLNNCLTINLKRLPSSPSQNVFRYIFIHGFGDSVLVRKLHACY